MAQPAAMTELDYIAWIRQQPLSGRERVLIGPGDDCAVLSWPADKPVLITTDMLLEGSCFRLAEAGPYRVGRKALAVNLSDIAAMAGRPVAAVVSVGLPRGLTAEQSRELFRGLADLAAAFEVALVGGDTNSWDGGLVVSVAVLGEPTGSGPVTRCGAEPGDWLLVTGPLGGSLAGHHLDFKPRVLEAQRLHQLVRLKAMIDLSDGLAKDLHQICQESRCGARLFADQIPITSAAQAAPDGRLPLYSALADGEDFELLFAVSPADGAALLRDQPLRPLGCEISHVGVCQAGGIDLVQPDGQVEPLPPLGYQHRW